MRHSLKLLVATIGVAAVVPLTGAPAEAAQANPTGSTAPASTVDWKPCPDAPGVDCGTVTVPIDWSKPGGDTIQISLARRKATDPAARIGSVLMDPGGPGGPGAISVKQGWTLSPAITRQFDTVGFDPRGVGDSHPVLCGLAEETAPFPVVPHSPEEFQQLLDHNKALGESCRAHTGPLFEHVDTVSVVHDMDAIRAALGEQKLTYYGVSYGTLMGQQYAETFPTHVRALVLDSNMDHSQSTTWGFLRSESTSAQENFDQFVAWCDRTEGCALHGQDVRAIFADLYDRASKGTLTDPASGTKIAPMDLLGAATSAFYGPSWARLASELAALRAGAPTATPLRAAAPTADAVPDAFQSVFCQDWRLPVHNYWELNAYRIGLELAVAPDMKRSPLGWSAATSCLGWPAKVNNPQHRLSVHGAPPLLMLNSRYDPATPYEWGQAASQQSGAALLTYDGWGHGSYFKHSQCVVDATDNYLITGKTPARGTHCAAVEPPANQARTAVPQVPGLPESATPRWGS
ncbi:alpha/beta hydrolase [Solihabitans fulvus]|uniref:Alpha/beta hydrolase n=1 Tax=Solihabitans fulvus TaxID=1892852 RepID=A0A5B2XBX1_9PSEU|nr:alpha/beta hydrolase [Solihabitans fulvus]KAA2260449.1 alpha/beta hydrolase [Solihabitans fulvus]